MDNTTRNIIKEVTSSKIADINERFLSEAGPVLHQDISLYFQSIKLLGVEIGPDHYSSVKRLVSDTFEGWLLAQDYHVNELDHSPLETRDDYEG